MEWVLLAGAVIALFLIYKRLADSKGGSGEKDLSVLPEQFIVFDLESTGLDPVKHEILEIGAIKVNRNSNNHTTSLLSR